MTKDVYVIKASGDRELFVEAKLRDSLSRAGATQEESEKVVGHVVDELEDGMSTDRIYRHAFMILKDIHNPRAMRRYSLRRALMDLGPTGFPFEKYFAELLKSKGFETANDQIMPGRCVEHEVDIVAWNETKLLMVEAKFHNSLGEKSDLKVALYVKARFDDLSENQFNYGRRRLLDEGWLVTNTKFTESAIQYGECAGLTMIGWNHPAKGSIRDLIEEAGLHPVTCLSNITNIERGLLLNNGMVLCRQVINAEPRLMQFGISKGKAEVISAEAKQICG